jgi:xanthine dehydrogenase small subunit
MLSGRGMMVHPAGGRMVRMRRIFDGRLKDCRAARPMPSGLGRRIVALEARRGGCGKVTALRHEIRFLLNDDAVCLGEVASDATLLDFLRLRRRLTGTKEGCAEGDCGACTVLVGRLTPSGLVYETVNACIRLLGSLDATHVVTVEALARGGALHPVQAALVAHHGSQCGFCTPGIVMSLYALWMRRPDATEAQIEKALQGNLCRCTGYAPIIRAARAASAASPDRDPLLVRRGRVAERLAAWRDGARVDIRKGDDRVLLPADVDDLARLLAAFPDATIVAGSTDVGLWVTKGLRRIAPVVFVSHLDALHRIEDGPDGLTLGAAVSYSEAFPAVIARFPALRELWDRIGGEQVRNMGTIGGNIANGSPIGDTPPPFIALGARLRLVGPEGRREIALEDFFIDYGRQDRRPSEFVESVFLPALPPGGHLAAYKVSKRRDEDITAVLGAFRLDLDGGRVADIRIAFGGMAGTPRRAVGAEAALRGRAWEEAAVAAAMEALDRDYTPLTDWRASAGYRRLVARNLLRRFWLETTGGHALRLARPLAEAI